MNTGTNNQCSNGAGVSRSRENQWAHCLSRAILWALLAAGPGLPAQNATAPVTTNEVTQAEDSATGDTGQTGEAGDEEMTDTNSVAGTNQSANPGPDARTRRINRRRAQSRPRNPQPRTETRSGSSGTNGVPASLDYSAFRLVVERNIFDPNRTPRSGPPAAQPKTVDSFTLVGTMSYEKGVFAFFDGTSSDFQKVLKPQDTIAGYKLVSISSDSVKLMQNTNVIELSVGSQMRRREDGSWERSAKSESYVAASASGSSKESSSSGVENDVIKRMMQRREKE